MEHDELPRYWVTLTWAFTPKMAEEASGPAGAWFDAVGAALDAHVGVADAEVSVGCSGFNISGVVHGDGTTPAIAAFTDAIAEAFKTAVETTPFPNLPTSSIGPRFQAHTLADAASDARAVLLVPA